MSTTAQIEANRANAQLSTGPKTDAGKAVVARNRLSHGLSSAAFSILPVEDPAGFEALVEALRAEHLPRTPTEHFLVTEMARAQWKLDRALRLEAEILMPDSQEAPEGWSAIAASFRAGCSGEQALLKLNRYEQTARRAWHNALNQLRKIRATAVRESRIQRSEEEAAVHRLTNAPVPLPLAPGYDSKPMPVHLQREVAAHKRRDPLFDPRRDASQMSKELRRWFERCHSG